MVGVISGVDLWMKRNGFLALKKIRGGGLQDFSYFFIGHYVIIYCYIIQRWNRTETVGQSKEIRLVSMV